MEICKGGTGHEVGVLFYEFAMCDLLEEVVGAVDVHGGHDCADGGFGDGKLVGWRLELVKAWEG